MSGRYLGCTTLDAAFNLRLYLNGFNHPPKLVKLTFQSGKNFPYRDRERLIAKKLLPLPQPRTSTLASRKFSGIINISVFTMSNPALQLAMTLARQVVWQRSNLHKIASDLHSR